MLRSSNENPRLLEEGLHAVMSLPEFYPSAEICAASFGKETLSHCLRLITATSEDRSLPFYQCTKCGKTREVHKCPDCGRLVANYFDHIAINCQRMSDREVDLALSKAASNGGH